MREETKLERRLRKALTEEFAGADGAGNGALQAKRELALRYYRCDPRGDENKGRSHAIAPELAASVNATLALMRGMLIEEGSVSVAPMGAADEMPARLETEVCHHLLYEMNAGELVLLHAIKDGLISGQAVVCIDVDQQDGDRQGGGGRDFTLRAVPSEHVFFQSAYEGRFQEIRFFAERRFYMRSDLVEMGVSRSKVERLGTGHDVNVRDADIGRKTDTSEDATDLIECYWCYVRLDEDGDGVAELHRVLTGPQREVLLREDADLIPYVLGNPFVSPHRLVGESLFDRLQQTQDVATSLTRQLLDNVSLINNGRYIYDPSRVTEEDILSPVAGGGIRARDPSSVVPMMIPDVSSGILAALEHTRRKRSEIAGAALDMASAEAQLMHKSATQASIDKSNSELVTSLIARNLALTLIEPLFRLAHDMLRTYSDRLWPARLLGEVMPVDPLQWPAGRVLTVKTGKTPGEKAQESQGLMLHQQMQAQAMQAGLGGVLADARTLYRTELRILELAGVAEAEAYMIDPQSQGAVEAAQAMQAQQQAQAEQMQAMQAQMLQLQTQLEQAKLAEDARQHDDEIRFKYFDANLDAETAEAKIAAEGVISLEKERVSAEREASRAERERQGGAEGRAAGAGGDRR